MFKLYSDLLIEIDSYKEEIENAARTRDNLMKQVENRKPTEISGQHYSDLPTGSRDYTSMDRTLIRIDTLTKRIDAYTEVLNDRLKDKAKMDEKFKKCEGLYYKVYDLNRVQKISLLKVSEMLGYSYDYVKEISAEISKKVI